MSSENKQAWFQLTVRQQQSPLINYTRKITLDVEAAKDVVQESFLKLWKEDYPEIVELIPPWLFRVCRNHAIDIKRREKRLTRTEDGAELAIVMGDQETRTEGNMALATLTRVQIKYQEVLILKLTHELSYKEIADITGHSVTNVGVLIHEGMKELRELLGANSMEVAND
ncbi:MAG: RNA polymerase sigma factor [Deltaproteobacteria bacterium]|nr:MAG: RNA polymerase sigma factor [Deltaproteobacteria bacterium]TNF31500.1 MAG: RNA polymerase sigma factor [Deltaproteobacteria bacterium]